MSTPTFTVVKGSIDPRPRFTIKIDGVALNLSLAVTVRLKMAKSLSSSAAALDVLCTLLDAPNGIVSPDWVRRGLYTPVLNDIHVTGRTVIDSE